MSTGMKDKKEMYTTEEYTEAVDIMDSKPLEAAAIFTKILQTKHEDAEVASQASKMQEECIYHLGTIYAKLGDESKVKQLMIDIRPFFENISKPRSAKIIRSLIDQISTLGVSTNFVISLCKDSIAWCVEEKRSFLRQRLEARLAALYSSIGEYKQALQLINKVARDVKKLDDKPLMVELELTEANTYYKLQNLAKAKAALTAARSNSNSFYCSPVTLAEIDMQAGILSAGEHDYRTAYSYFYEAYEGYNSNNRETHAISALKYMMLCKIMSNQASDVYNIINSKAGTKYADKVLVYKKLADAYVAQDLIVLENIITTYNDELQSDALVLDHINNLRDQLFEKNLLRLLKPYSIMHLDTISKKIGLPVEKVQARISRMILDGVIHAYIDEHANDVIFTQEEKSYDLYTKATTLVQELGVTVDKLEERAKVLRQLV